jgi:hypothetical protein
LEERSGERRPSLSGGYPGYVCRVTADEGDIGRGHMQQFQDVETRTPVILTTGLDAPTCRNVVLVRLVNSMDFQTPSLPQKPARQGRHNAPAARSTRSRHPKKGTTHRGNHG